mgnify:CR=1 FL=1
MAGRFTSSAPSVGDVTRRRVSSGTEWEDRVGYSRAVRTGDTVRVAGTTAVDEDGEPMTDAGPAAQTERALDIVGEALADVDAALSDVVRTRSSSDEAVVVVE